eukprot:30999-Pelagococcus_subviridis.AAC.4
MFVANGFTDRAMASAPVGETPPPASSSFPPAPVTTPISSAVGVCSTVRNSSHVCVFGVNVMTAFNGIDAVHASARSIPVKYA